VEQVSAVKPVKPWPKPGRQVLTPQESAAWLRNVANHINGWETWPVQPADFMDSYRSQFVAIVVSITESLAQRFPGAELTLEEWGAIDKRMREILTAAEGPGGAIAPSDRDERSPPDQAKGGRENGR